MDPSKVFADKEWPLPTDVKQLQSFLGFCSYYNWFIKNYSRITASLTKLLQKDAAFTQGKQQQQPLEELVHALTSAPILQMPQFDKPFTVHVDASDVAIGAILTQKVNEIDIPVCYYSKRLNETEAR